MKEETAKKGFKVISITALILKIITILTIIAVLATIVISIITNKNHKEEVEESQVVAEIVYTDDVKEYGELEKLKDFFGLKIYEEKQANDNILTITVMATIVFVVGFILLVLIFDGVQKIFRNLYKTDDGFYTAVNARTIKNIGIIAILRFLIPLITSVITKIKLGASVSGRMAILQAVCTAVIVLVSFISYYKIQSKIKE